MASDPNPRPYTVRDKPLTCPHCGHDHFFTRRTLLNTRGFSFFGWDWLNADARNYVCAACGHMSWFMDLPP